MAGQHEEAAENHAVAEGFVQDEKSAESGKYSFKTHNNGSGGRRGISLGDHLQGEAEKH